MRLIYAVTGVCVTFVFGCVASEISSGNISLAWDLCYAGAFIGMTLTCVGWYVMAYHEEEIERRGQIITHLNQKIDTLEEKGKAMESRLHIFNTF